MWKKLQVAAIGLLAYGASFNVSAGTQDFYLINSTGAVIYELYVSWTGRNSWEEDILGEYVLDAGTQIPVYFSGREACVWDMMAVDGEGNSIPFYGIDLCRTNAVELTCDGYGTCYATLH